MLIRISKVLVRGVAAVFLVVASGISMAQSPLDTALNALSLNTGGNLSFAAEPTQAYTLVRASSSRPLLVDDPLMPAEDRARAFLAEYGAVAGINDQSSQLALQRTTVDRAGGTHVHLSQVHEGVDVFGARLVVHMNDSGIQGVSGVFVPGLAGLSTTPQIDAALAQTLATQAMRKTHPDLAAPDFEIEKSRLVMYKAGLLELHDGRTYLAHEVFVRSTDGTRRERFIIDAMGGGTVNRINEIHDLKNREIYTPNQLVPPVLVEGSPLAPADPPLTGDTLSDPASRAPRPAQDDLYIFAGGTYDLYSNLFDYEGYDDGTTHPLDQVQKSVFLINEVCPNAYWNGDSTNYCPGIVSDDVVSHEWTHGYTEFSHGLIYQYQSGALNESYSDIFGEVYDLVNGIEGPQGVNFTEGEYYENGGSRWVLGEDLTEPVALALLRDMWDPDSFGFVPGTGREVLNGPSPGSVITSPNYFCGTSDGGGVHTNSGVPNHAFAMLVDGKEFNDVTIPAIGMTRAVHIYFHAMVNYQTPTTNFMQHADALTQSCQDLIGVELNNVLGFSDGDTVSQETCDAVEAAMLAVEMRQSPVEKCNYQPLLRPQAETPAICGENQIEIVGYSETWESTAAGSLPEGWTFSEDRTGDSTEGFEWEVVDDLPLSHAGGKAAFVPDSFGGSCAPGGDISTVFQLTSPSITVAADNAHFRMEHLMQSEFEYDGGNLKISINGGAFQLVAPQNFRWNSYNDSIDSGCCAIAGERGWTGSDQGESFSDWGDTIVDLGSLGVGAGDTVQFRFDFGQDGCNGNLGWFVDDLAVGHCEATEDAGSRSNPLSPGAGNFVTPAGTGGSLGWLTLALLLGLRRRR